MVAIKTAILKRADSSNLQDIRGLLAQVRSGSDKESITIAQLREVLKDRNTLIIVAKDGVRIVGMATLCIMVRIGRQTGQVEDVVVDETYRGQGLGKQLMNKLIELAQKKKLKAIYLTGRPARVAANALYPKIGFEKRETNAYCLKL
ncbi:MAG: GNAT family N-acetyltransferase [bacterium]|nr:GNAT family N-acetyltransferase [bacterium]